MRRRLRCHFLCFTIAEAPALRKYLDAPVVSSILLFAKLLHGGMPWHPIVWKSRNHKMHGGSIEYLDQDLPDLNQLKQKRKASGARYENVEQYTVKVGAKTSMNSLMCHGIRLWKLLARGYIELTYNGPRIHCCICMT